MMRYYGCLKRNFWKNIEGKYSRGNCFCLGGIFNESRQNIEDHYLFN